MRSQPEDRAVMLGAYILDHHATVRAAAGQFGISKSTVHKDVSERLPRIAPGLAAAVSDVLQQNKQERHIRGGMASVADLFVAQMQDYLELGGYARTNTPGTSGNNWQWRMLPGADNKRLAKRLRVYTETFRRL